MNEFKIGNAAHWVGCVALAVVGTMTFAEFFLGLERFDGLDEMRSAAGLTAIAGFYVSAWCYRRALGLY